MGTHPESSATSQKTGGRPLLQTVERLLGFSALATLLVYLLGVYIVAEYLSQYDVSISSLARWRYLAAGTSLVVYLGLGALPAALLSHAVLDWLCARLAVGSLRYGLFLMAAYGVGVGGILLCVAARNYLPEWTAPGEWNGLRFFVFLLGTGLAFGPLLTYGRRRVAVEPTPLRLWWLAVLLFAVAWVCASQYGALYYEHIPRGLGGGEPSTVTVIVDGAGASALAEALRSEEEGEQPQLMRTTGETTAHVYVKHAQLIDEDADTYYVRLAKKVEQLTYDAEGRVNFDDWEFSNCVRLSKAHVHGIAFVPITRPPERYWFP